ncbi:MAG: MFS transporter [Desulfobacterales bacterium]|nr:MFS transporter [Desulfobacterales bacterium]
MKKDVPPPGKPMMSAQYFLHFAVMGILLPYFNLYCYHLGFSGFQIGLLSSIKSTAMVLFPLLWGGLADRFQMRRALYIGCNFLSAGIWIFFIFTTDFRAMLLITIFHAVFYSPIIAFLEAFTMDLLKKEKNSYGSIRAWGSISFILAVSLTGKFIDMRTIEIIVMLTFFGSFSAALVSTQIPRVVLVSPKMDFSSNARQILKKRTLVFLTSGFLMLVSHGTYYGFYSIHLEKLGFPSSFIGLTWAMASTAEIFVMLRSKSILKTFSIEKILFFSFLTAVFRWMILFWAQSGVIILISQITHAATYGTFHIAGIIFMDSQVPEGAKTLGQAVNNAVTYGFGLTVGLLLNGYFFEILGASGMFLISAGFALAGTITWIIFQMMGKSGILADHPT